MQKEAIRHNSEFFRFFEHRVPFKNLGCVLKKRKFRSASCVPKIWKNSGSCAMGPSCVRHHKNFISALSNRTKICVFSTHNLSFRSVPCTPKIRKNSGLCFWVPFHVCYHQNFVSPLSAHTITWINVLLIHNLSFQSVSCAKKNLKNSRLCVMGPFAHAFAIVKSLLWLFLSLVTWILSIISVF